MADPRRQPHADDHEGRESQIEVLLDAGLDRYFAGRFEDAINLWTRVLFLDRSHQRARAYIDRARTGLAERQRRSDEMLHVSRDLLEQGQPDAARRLLADAMAAHADDAQVAALRARLDRLERAGAVDPLAVPSAPPAPVPGWSWTDARTRLARGMWPAAATVASAVLLLALSLDWWRPAVQPVEGFPPVSTVPLPLLDRSEVAIVRARALFAQGRLAEALEALDRAPADGPDRAAVDAFRIEIQQLLLASVRTTPSGSARENQR